MKMSLRSGAAAFVLLVLGASLAFAAPTEPTGAVSETAALYSSASVQSKQIATLSPGAAFRVLETAARDETVGGKKGRWLRVSTPDGKEGWFHGGSAVVRADYLLAADFPDADAYGAYLSWALRKGERVRAAQDYEKVVRGDMGWYYSMDEGDPPILVVWDRDVDANPWVEALPEDFPRILSGRVYFVYPSTVEVASGAEMADFEALARSWRETASPQTLFPAGSRVILGEHAAALKDDPDSKNWDPGMAEYVGSEAVVTDHQGSDAWDRPVVTVDVDGGEYSWRVENLELVERMAIEYEDYEYGDDEYSDEGGYEEDYEEDYGADFPGLVREGERVILGRHDERNGGDNWTEEMDAFVGTEATVTEILGTDPQGFLVVAVEENSWSWRIRSLTVKGRGEAGSYGYRAGDRVVLDRHRSVDGNENWNPAMDEFVGQTATILELVGARGDAAGCFLVRVDADKGKWVWRVESLTSAE